MSKYTQAEKDEIMRQAREHIAFAPRPLHIPQINSLEQYRAEAAERAAAVEAEQQRYEREARRDREARSESAAVAELRAEVAELRQMIEGLRSEIRAGDIETLDVVYNAICPVVEKAAAAIGDLGRRVDQKLADMENEIRGSIKRERSNEPLDLPPLRNARNLN